MITCENRGACKVYECVLTNGLLHKQEAELKVRFDFDKKTAVEKFEKFSKFLVAVSICPPASDQQERVCVDNRWMPRIMCFIAARPL